MEQIKVKQKKKKTKNKSVDNKSPNNNALENNPRIELTEENAQAEHIESENTECASTSVSKSLLKNYIFVKNEEKRKSKISTTDESNSTVNTDSSFEMLQDVMTLTDDEIFEIVIENTPPDTDTLQPPVIENIDNIQETTHVTTDEKPSAPSYKELNAIVNEFHDIEIDAKNENTVMKKVVHQETIPFCFEEIENIFGMNEIIRTRAFSVEFEKYELQSPSHTHPLYEALTEYQRARTHLIANEKKIETVMSEFKENFSGVWSVKECTKRSGDRCGDGFYYSESYNYTDANFQDSIFINLQNDLSSLRSKVCEIHSLYSHSEHFLKIQIDELIWNSIVNGSLSMKESLRILFWVLRTSGWGYDKVLRQQLRSWCCYLANALYKREDSLPNSLFILHHVLRISQGIRWALHLVKCNVNSVNDVQNAICMLETILLHSKINPEQNEKSHSDRLRFDIIDNDDDRLMVAHEADESLWTVVDSDGEGADVDTLEPNIIALKETDIVGLIKQIPFKNIFRELMLVKNNGSEDVFCGSNLSSGSILKVFAANRLILKIIRSALLYYKNYLELTKELCRIASDCVMYCTDLWESSMSQCEANLYERISVEYNNVFLAGWSTIKAARSKEISHLFFSELPFKFCLIQHISDIFKSLFDQFVVSDDNQCYYTLVTFSNMAISRTENDFIIKIVKTLFEIGYLSDFSELVCGEWARSLCGAVLRNAPQFTRVVLNMVSPKISNKWLDHLPLNLWRPESDEIMDILNNWAIDKIDLIPFLLKALDWKCQGGLSLNIQRTVAIFLCTLAEKLSKPKKPPPEWMWECILILKLHLIEWEINIMSAPQPDTLCNLDLTGKFQITNFTLILMSSWGHSYPQIFQNAAPFLIKLAISGRYTEVIHVIYYIIPILSEQPESIKECKTFKELLQIIIQAEKSYTKIATRLISQDFPGPIVKMLADMIRFQLYYFSKFRMTSINFLVSIWINWLTSQDNWESEWIIIYLLDVVLGCCFLHYNCLVDAANIFKQLIQSKLPSSPKSATSSSLSSWLWNSSSSYKGLIQCNMEAPFLSHIILWIEHTSIERETGIWQKLIEKLTFHEEGNKVNIDKTLKSIGGGDTSNNLVIYRSLQCAINTSISHPIVTLLWQLFFYLYLDKSFLNPDAQEKHVGPLFFQGLINSRILFKARARLLEIKTYHEKKVEDLSKVQDIQNKKNNERITYHTQQSKLFNTLNICLDDNFFDNFNSGNYSMDPHFGKISTLMAGYNGTWSDTIDMYELENYQNSSYSSMSATDLEKYNIDDSSEPSSFNKSHDINLLPGEKIIIRLKTYEDPLLETTENCESNNLTSIIDPSLFKDTNKVFLLIKNHLNAIKKHAEKYFVKCHQLNEINVSLFKALPTLYEKKRFLKVHNKSCGTNCNKSAQITLQGTESVFKISVNEEIIANRNIHESVMSELTQPYKDLAINTAVLSKLAQLTCNESILNNECGIVFFNIIMETLNENILKFPPAKQILNTLVTHLGEKFISGNGKQCIALINHYKDLGNMNIVCSLLRPLELSTEEMLDLYETVSISVTNNHVAFSCLSKFHISNWLKDIRPPITKRSRLLKHICIALGTFGNSPPEDRLSVQELLCVHLNRVLSWEFPAHLSQVVSLFCDLTLEQKLPPSCWEHCITVIETYPHLVSHRLGSRIMELFGQQWWSKRNNNGSSGLHHTYEIYIPSVARLGASFSSTILNSAMLYQPLLLTHQITSVVFNAITSFWNVWLVPWWGGMQPIWQVDPRNPMILPWSINDVKGPEIILDAFVETISYCINTLPGSNIDFLQLTWQWYLNNYPHVLVSPHIINKVHKALLKIPWTSNANLWITFADLQIVSQICNNNLPLCHTFILQCLRDKKWTLWFIKLSPMLQPKALRLLLPVLFKLRSEKNVIVDAISLPWNLLKYEHFEEILNWFMYIFKNPLKPFYSDEMFLLLCAMAGFKNHSDRNESWQLRRLFLIKVWVNNLALYSQEIIDAKQKVKVNESIASNVTDLLNKIETVSLTLVNSNDSQQLSECTHLLNTAIMMLNTVTLQDVTIQSWTDWVTNASKISMMSLICCVVNITQKNIFANLAECALTTYFKNKGKWVFIKNAWKNNCIISIEYLISVNSLLTSIATYISLDPMKYDGKMFDQVDKRIIQMFHNLEPKSTSESKICLWICYMVSLTCNSSLSDENSKYIFENASIILEKWSQEPSWEILKAIRLVQNVSPSYKFRIITRYVYCAITDLHDKIHGNSSAAYKNNSTFCKIISSLEGMTEQKNYSEVKHTLLKFVEYSKDKNHTRENTLKRVTDLCIEIYSDINYLIDTIELFQ